MSEIIADDLLNSKNFGFVPKMIQIEILYWDPIRNGYVINDDYYGHYDSLVIKNYYNTSWIVFKEKEVKYIKATSETPMIKGIVNTIFLPSFNSYAIFEYCKYTIDPNLKDFFNKYYNGTK